MYIAVYENPEFKENKLFCIDINKYTWQSWYSENMRRHKENIDLPIYDVDEVWEIWNMSINHLKDMIDFLKVNK